MKWSHIERARRILAREQGAVVKDWGGKLPIALVYPNTYHVGMSSLGLHAVYRLLNAHPDVVCERAFWRRQLAAGGAGNHPAAEPITSIETQRPLGDFGVIAFSLSFEMDYPHLVQVLRQTGIPLQAEARDETWPLVIAGGPAVSANPLPLADFLDGAVVGEAEQIIDPLIQTLWDTLSEPRDVAWQALARIPGIYVPHLRNLPAEAVGRRPKTALPPPVQRQWVRDLDAHPTATVVHTPDTEFGEMHLIEVARGCGRGCRFCLAGYLCRPKRERSVDAILRPRRIGRQIEVTSHVRDHRTFLLAYLVPVFLICGSGVMVCAAVIYVDPFRVDHGVIAWAVAPATGYVGALAGLCVAVLSAGAVGAAFSLRRGRNLLPAAMQVAAYLGGYLVVWACFAAATSVGTVAMLEAYVFVGWGWLLGAYDDDTLALLFWIAVNLPCVIVYVVLVWRGTAAARYANR